jgi:L-asparaginase/Glu-tRNA(Gln) amidotransferase subunit D
MPRLTLVFVLLCPSLVLAQPLPRVVVLATGGTIASISISIDSLPTL